MTTTEREAPDGGSVAYAPLLGDTSLTEFFNLCSLQFWDAVSVDVVPPRRSLGDRLSVALRKGRMPQ